MREVVQHILLLAAGAVLFWLADWNIKKEDEQEKKTSTAKYWILMFTGGMIVLVALLYLLNDLVSMF